MKKIISYGLVWLKKFKDLAVIAYEDIFTKLWLYRMRHHNCNKSSKNHY